MWEDALFWWFYKKDKGILQPVTMRDRERERNGKKWQKIISKRERENINT